MDAIFLSFSVLIAIAVLTILGHGLWLFFAFLFRLIMGDGSASPRNSGQSSEELSEPTVTQKIQADVQAARRLADYSRFQGWLDSEQHALLNRQLQALTDRALDPSSASRAEPSLAQADPPPALPAVSSFSQAEAATAPPVVHPLEQPEPATNDIALQHSELSTKLRQEVAGPIGASLLKAFMEQTNIRWIEVVSGLLIIVCSVGLVISLWNTLSATSRFFPSMVFMVATLAVHAAGQYTLRQWKLRSTSRGILHIGLMLIPLAVLVGILLSHREGQPARLDITTWAILVVGTLLYGGAAFTATRSLFAARSWPVATAVIVGSLTLIPIHFLGSAKQLQNFTSAVILVPLVAVGLWNALRLSQRQLRFASRLKGQNRLQGQTLRDATMVVHCIFSAGVPAVFWWMSAGDFSEITQAALAMMGLLLAGWASWGWTASLTRLFAKPQQRALRSSSSAQQYGNNLQSSWLVIAAWTLAIICSLSLTAIVWLTSGNRIILGGFLFALGAWWLLHGLRCRLFVGTLAGFVAATVSAGLFLEWTFPESAIELSGYDWFSFSRVSSLYLSSLLLSTIGALLLRFYSGWTRSTPVTGSLTAVTDSRPRMLAFSQLGAGATVTLSATVLTAIASLVPWSQPAYGGSWAPSLLVLVGSLLTALVTFISALPLNSWLPTTSGPAAADQRPESHSISQRGLLLMAPLSQAILLLGIVCWCQNAPLASDWIAGLRPDRAWSIGLGGLGLIWAIISALLRQSSLKSESFLSNCEVQESIRGRWIEWFGFSSVIVGLTACIAYWTRDDRLMLAGSLGWILPAVLILCFIAFRKSYWRESSLLTAAIWLCTLTVRLGWINQWWESLGLSASVAVAVLPIACLLAVYQMILKWPGDLSSWVTAGPRWAYRWVLNASWLALIAALIPALLGQFETSIQSNNVMRAEFASDQSAIFSSFTWGRSSLIVLGLMALSALTWWKRTSANQWETLYIATVPTLLAGVIGCNVTPPHSVPAALWLLAGFIIAYELLPFSAKILGSRFSRWSSIKSDKPTAGSAAGLFYSAESFSLAAILLGSIVMVLLHWTGGLPEVLRTVEAQMQSWTGRLDNIRRLSIWLAPLPLVCAVRWLGSVFGASTTRQISRRGYALSAAATLLSATAATNQSDLFVLLSTRHFALATSLIALATLGMVILWNWILLRQLDPRLTLAVGLPKAMKGARWRTAEESVWQLWLGSIVAAGVLTLIAGLLVAYYPRQQLAAIGRLGDWWTLISVSLAIGLGWLLGLYRGLAKFGLAGLTFGLLAPILAAGYGSWLIAHPASRFVSAANHEPYRMLICLWLAALVCGVVIRIQYARRGKPLYWLAEMAWISIAAFVGGLSLLSLNVDSYWSFAQLLVLVTLIAVSGEVSQQKWRGYTAAGLGVLAWTPFISGGAGASWLHFPWQSLWGATWVGLAAIGSRLVLNSFGFSVSGSASTIPRVDRATCLLVSVASIALGGLWILMQPGQVTVPSTATWIVVSLVIGNLLMAIARLWDCGPSHRGWSVYWALLAAVMVIANAASSTVELTRMNAELVWLSGLLGGMTLLAFIWRELSLHRLPLSETFTRKGLVTDEKLSKAGYWMSGAHTAAALLCLLPSLWLVLNLPEVAGRLTATILPMLGAACILPLSFERPRHFQRGSVLLLASATLILAWWADLPAAWSLREEAQSWLFMQRAMLACTTLGLVYPLIAWRRGESDLWSGTLLNAGWICLGLSGAVGLGMIVGNGVHYWQDFPVSASTVIKLSVLLAWSAVFIRLIQFAARPFGLDQQASLPVRSGCVYAGEATLLLAGISTYQLFPNLFSGIFLQWWPLVVFGIAFVSAGIGHWLSRSRQQVLADPIHRTNILLPLIPLAGVWWAKPQTGIFAWSDWGSYWLLLATASSLYGLYGWLRNSVTLRGLSALVALLSFWAYLLSHPNLQFFERPQFWLLPPALGALLFVEWNRSKLDARAVTMARYLCVLIAYLSSSAEVFLRSIEGNLWPPLWLLALSLGGVMAGLIMRIRAFLYCGVTFVGVALFGMVWHAAQAIDQVWPWWAFGIATGVGLIVLLGYFEKNRAKVLKYLEQVRSWQP